MLKFVKNLFKNKIDDKRLHVNLFDKILKNPIGLISNIDINGDNIKKNKKCGFSYIEIGTFTLKENGIPNFDNKGFYHVAENLVKINRKDCAIGISVVSKELKIFAKLSLKIADYISVNMENSINEFRNWEFLENALENYSLKKPIFIKISSNDFHIQKIIDLSKRVKIFGIIANIIHIKKLYQHFGESVPIIAYGQIKTSDDVLMCIKNGATAVQIANPYQVKKITKDLIKDANCNGWTSLKQLRLDNNDKL